MVVTWLLDAALTIAEWFVSLFGALPVLSLPAGISLVVPVPLLGAGGASSLGAWLAVAVAVSVALVIGKVLQWLYSLIPFKMT